VPGWGTSGILMGLAGGTNTTFVSLAYFNTLHVSIFQASIYTTLLISRVYH
jgi:hypothetical protein